MKRIVASMVLGYLRRIAKLALSQSRATIIGVAGSVGKTSTREALFAILRDIAPTHMVAGNSETGIPLGIVGLFPTDYSPLDWLRMLIVAPFRIRFLANMRYVIVEMGIDDPYPPKNMEYLLTIVQPDVGIITEESAAHTMQFEKVLPTDTILSEKDRLHKLITAITHEDAKMLAGCSIKIINKDNPFIKKEVPDGLSFSIDDYRVATSQTVFTLTIDKQTVPLTFRGYAFPKNLGYAFGAALLAAHKLHIPLDVACKKLETNFIPPKGRESIFEGKDGTTIIDSSYNASKESVLSFVSLLGELKKQTKRHTVLVLADMLELGNEAQIEHEAVAKAIGTIPDTLFLVGPLTKRFILPKFPDAEWFPTIIELNAAIARIPRRSLILFKGSQGQLWLEESIKMLLQNKEDVMRLCRQTAFWKKVKKAAGRWVEV